MFVSIFRSHFVLKNIFRYNIAFLLFYSFVILPFGCSNGAQGNAPGTPCVTISSKQACSCNDKTGEQECGADSKWGVCHCASGSGEGGNSGDGGGSGTKEKCATPEDTKVCLCDGSPRGVQTCSKSKFWSTCVCSAPSKDCKANETQGCTCQSQVSGKKSCLASGKWGTCVCGSTECQPKQIRQCICKDGKSVGRNDCQGGKWSACAHCKLEPVCKSGDTLACQCSNGGLSRKVCQSNRQWGKCECGGPACKVGEKQKTPCLCPNGQTSERFCKKNSKGKAYWGGCECSCQKSQTKVCSCPNQQSGKRSCSCSSSKKCYWGTCKCAVCKSNNDCKNIKGATFCQINTGRCVSCLKASDCKGTKSKVCRIDGQCVGCLKTSDCSLGMDCYPLDNSCKAFPSGQIAGSIKRCKDGVPRPEGCAGNPLSGDSKGDLYLLFFSGRDFPPKYSEKPFLVKKIAKVDFSSDTKVLSYKVDDIPEGSWLVYVFLDDNQNWSMKQHMPDTGDLVGFLARVVVVGNHSKKYDFFLWDRY